jgi:2-oxoglutarate dehydrogenase E2 component (dihydrolipoamide succinyltransferase)
MSKFEVVVPRLGESVIEVILTRWLRNEGEQVEGEETLVEIATDKVDSEIPSPVSGKLIRKLFKEGDVIPVGKVFAIIETEGGEVKVEEPEFPKPQPVETKPAEVEKTTKIGSGKDEQVDIHSGTRYYSPLVRSIARQEGISFKELDIIPGTGKDDRLTKQDILNYISIRKEGGMTAQTITPVISPVPASQSFVTGEDLILEMDRVRQLIAGHMVRSVQTSPHVTSFVEVDMGRIVSWRDKYKDAFQKKYNEKLTFTPIFIEAIAKSARDFPMVNVSVDGTKILIHSKVNIGMAVALPGNLLIVPVVRNAGNMNLLGITKAVNDLANRARLSKLVPDEISGGTISLTNLGSFGTLMGTPIINQPQTAIVAVGVIKKRPVVIETADGDLIGIKPMMICSLTFDHRVIDGALGGQFLNRLSQYLEQFDINQTI